MLLAAHLFPGLSFNLTLVIGGVYAFEVDKTLSKTGAFGHIKHRVLHVHKKLCYFDAKMYK